VGEHAHVDARLRALAVEMAPALLAEIVESGRRRAAEILTERFAALLLEEFGRLDSPASPPTASAASAVAPPATISPAASPPPSGGWYLYGLTWSSAAGALEGAPGIAGSTLQTITAGVVAAVVSQVQAGGTAWGIDSRGEPDLDALLPRLQEHETVLETVLERGPVLPARFGLLFPDRGALERTLAARQAALVESLEALDGKSEWGLTVSWHNPPAGAAGPLGGTAESGRGYLGRRQAEGARAAAVADLARDLAASFHAALLDVACAGVRHAPGRTPALTPEGSARRTPEAIGSGGRVLLKASYLVPDDGEERFRRVAGDLLSSAPAELSVSGELTGPWPAFNFADLDLEGVPA
jgi:Gas vesicle synthesis protein GvpL/GvpF